MNCRDQVAERYEAPRNDLFTVVYIGNLHPDRFVLELVRVVQSLEGVRLLIGGRDHLEKAVAEACKRDPRTTFLGEVSADQVMAFTRRADAVVCMLDPANRNYRRAYPAKGFDAMATGRPVIISRGNAGADIVAREACGLVVEFAERGLRGALRTLRDDPKLAERLGRAGLAAAKREYNWAVQERRFLEAVKDLQGG
jgi:glycosyltransferase involved in cell wall biosynthesis